MAVPQRLPRGRPRDVLLPESERGPRRRAREAAAKSLCSRCPVVAQCLRHALGVREPYGVWGGLNATERSHILRETA